MDKMPTHAEAAAAAEQLAAVKQLAIKRMRMLDRACESKRILRRVAQAGVSQDAIIAVWNSRARERNTSSAARRSRW